MRTRFKIIKTWDQLLKLIECCKKSGYACVDFETNAEGIYNKGFKPTILSVTFQAGSGCSIPLNHPETKDTCEPGWNWKKALLKFGHEVIEDYNIVKLAWNGKFDFQIFNLYGIFYRGTLIDGMLAKYCLNEERPNGLKDMVRRYLPDVANYEADKGFDKLPWDQKPLKPLCKYGCQDTDYTFRLTIFFESRLIELGFYNLYRNLIMTSSRVLQSCEVNGLYMDRGFNEKLLAEYKPKIDKARETCLNLAHVKAFEKWYNMQKIGKYVASIQAELEELDYNDPKDAKKIANREQKISNIKAGIFSNKKERDLVRPLNLGSPVDLPQLLYSKEGFHMPIIKYTTDSKTGKPTDKPSTDEDTLTELRLKYKNPKSPKAIFLDSLLELRGLEKMYKTYIEGWHEKVQYDSCLHGKYNIIGTTSGRLSSSDPNLQQVPKTSVDPNIKNQLIAQPGKLYLVSDFSQAELRFMAHLAKDKTYLDAFNSGNDPHLAIAAQKYGVPYEEAYKMYHDEDHPDHKLWKVRRKQAKQIAFGLIYGIGAKLLAVKLSDPKAGLIVTPEEAQKEMDIFFKQHPRLKKFKAKQEKYLQEHGYLMSLFGRRRRLPQIYGDNKDQAYAKRMALNFPCLLPTSQALCKTKGWVNSDNLEVGDEILAFNSKTGKSEWQPVLEVHTPDYNGDLYRFSSKHCGILSTSYHRWYVSKSEFYEEDVARRKEQDKEIEKFFSLQKTIHDKYEEGLNLHQVSKELGLSYTKVRRIYYGKVKSPLTTKPIEPFSVLTSEEIYKAKGNCRIPIRAFHNNNNNNSYSEEFIALCGWYLTDAHVRRDSIRITQSDSANHDKVLHIQRLLKDSKLEYKERVRIGEASTVVNWDISKESSKNFIELLPDRKLNMRFLTSLTQSQLEVLLENMRMGDGYNIFCSGDKEQAALVQALVVLIGKSSSMFQLSYKGKKSYFKDHKPSKLGQEYIEATKDSWGIKFSNRGSVHTKSYGRKLIEKVPYQGKVWCPSVPSGAFFVRYIGEDGRYRTMITGNCQSCASDVTLFGSVLIYYLMRQGKLPKMDEVATVHDACYYNTEPSLINIWTISAMWEIFRDPDTKPYFGFHVDDVTMDMDYTIGRTMAEELPFIPGYDYNKMLQPDFSVEEYMKEAKKYEGISIAEYKTKFKKEIKAYQDSWLKYQDFKHVKPIGILK